MANSLTNKSYAKSGAMPLTTKNTVPFCIAINHQLENNFNFKHKKLNTARLKEFHAFIDKSVGQSISVVEKLYKRETDTNDKYGASRKQVIHFGFGENFRVHGYYEKDYFVLCRLDPAHDKHKD